MVELRTKQEIQRDKLHKTICGQYNEFRQLMPNATPTRIFTAIAQRHGMTSMGVRKIIIRNGLYSPAKVNDN